MATKTQTKKTPPAARAPAAAAAAPQQPVWAPAPIEERALEYLKTVAFEAILDAPEAQRITDLTRAVIDRLRVTLSDEESGGLASVIRLTLDSDPRFAQTNRMWDLALRMGRADADRKKPVERSIEDFVDQLGLPAEADRIATLTGLLYGREPDYFKRMLDRIAPVQPKFFLTPDGKIGISRWLLRVESDDPDDVRFDNFANDRDLAAADEAARAGARAGAHAGAHEVGSGSGSGSGGGKADNPVEYARRLAEKSAAPLPFKPLAFQVWNRFRDVESQALFNDLAAAGALQGRGVRLLPGPLVAASGQVDALMEAIRQLARNPEAVTPMLAVTQAAAGGWAGSGSGAPAAPSVSASDADVDQVYDFIEREPLRSYRVSELSQVVLETFPGSRSYAGMHDSLLEKMRSDRRFQWVGFERFRLDGLVPDEVQVLPEGLAFDERAYVDETQEHVDRLTAPETWKYGLAREIHNPLALDVGDDDSEGGAAPASLRKSLLLHHYFAGTAYVPHMERTFFPAQPDLIEFTLVTPEGQRFDAWFNHRLGLIFGLRAWYEQLDAESRLESWSGPVFTITPTKASDEFRLEFTDEVEQQTFVPRERLPQLFGVLRGEAEAEGWPLTTIVTSILRDYPDGLAFVPVFTQANIVRRARRDAVASVLSAQRSFMQNPQQPGVIRFDEKRAEKKAKKRGPRRIEEYDEDEDLDIE